MKAPTEKEIELMKILKRYQYNKGDFVSRAGYEARLICCARAILDEIIETDKGEPCQIK